MQKRKISIGEAACQTREEWRDPKLVNLLATTFFSRNVWSNEKPCVANEKYSFSNEYGATKEEKKKLEAR